MAESEKSVTKDIFDLIDDIEVATTSGTLKEACQKYLPWTCPHCTFENQSYPGVCEICDTPRWNQHSDPKPITSEKRATGMEYVHQIYQSLGLPKALQDVHFNDKLCIKTLVCPTREEFSLAVLSNSPVIIKDLPQFKRASSIWTREYLSKKCGDRSIPVRMKADITDEQVYQSQERRFSSYLSNPQHGYAARLILRDHLPEIEGDVPAMKDHPFRSCFGLPMQQGTIMYLGHGLQKTPLHFDSAENILHQIQGTKTFYLFPPGTREILSPSNLSRSTVYSDLDFFHSDTFLKLKPLSLKATLSPGDALYLPVTWFHAVQGGKGLNMSVHYWFQMHDDKIDGNMKLAALYRV